MFFLSNQFRLPNKPQVVFNNSEIAFKSEVRLLSTDITENLKWKFHVCSLCSSRSKVSY